jgi:hypothetical protein
VRGASPGSAEWLHARLFKAALNACGSHAAPFRARVKFSRTSPTVRCKANAALRWRLRTSTATAVGALGSEAGSKRGRPLEAYVIAVDLPHQCMQCRHVLAWVAQRSAVPAETWAGFASRAWHGR